MSRLTIVQYAGDYREAVERFASGGAETYRAQRYSVDTVSSLTQKFDSVSVVCGLTEDVYETHLANGVHAIGVGGSGKLSISKLIAAVAQTKPTHLVITTPQQRLIWWAIRQDIPTLAVFADSFGHRSWRSKLRTILLAHMLNHRTFRWVANHGLNACLSLLAIGVRPDKIIPWDWPTPYESKAIPARVRSACGLQLAYVGLVTEAKGVGDLLAAIAILRERGLKITATVAGLDPDGTMLVRAQELRIDDHVEFVGLIPNDAVGRLMAHADVVMVPSRHSYPEGLPLVIYEALAARTPIIASDHPMFSGAIINDESALIFPATDVNALAAAIERIDADSALYALLSSNAAAAWQALQLPVMWHDLLTRWLEQNNDSQTWLAAHSIASGIYDERLAVRRAAMAKIK